MVALKHVGIKQAQIALVPLIIVTGVCTASAAHPLHANHRVLLFVYLGAGCKRYVAQILAFFAVAVTPMLSTPVSGRASPSLLERRCVRIGPPCPCVCGWGMGAVLTPSQQAHTVGSCAVGSAHESAGLPLVVTGPHSACTPRGCLCERSGCAPRNACIGVSRASESHLPSGLRACTVSALARMRRACAGPRGSPEEEVVRR